MSLDLRAHRLVSTLFVAGLIAVEPPTVAQVSGLKVAVIAGEDAVNIIQQKTAVTPIVEVRDRNNLPVPGAAVTFTIGSGNTTFAGGSQTITVTTNAAGRAISSAMTPLNTGQVQIQVNAAFQGQTATASIAQTNVMTAAEAAAATGGATAVGGAAAGAVGGGVPWLAIGALAGGAGAAATLVLPEAEADRQTGSTAPGAASAPPVVDPRPPETPAPPLSVTVSPTSLGISGVTVFTFTATGGGSSGYTWDFGDGSSANGNPVTHNYARDGTFTASARTVGANNATSTSPVTVGSLTGIWLQIGPAPPASGVNFRLVLTQQGGTISGQWSTEYQPGSIFGRPESPRVSSLTGTVDAALRVTLASNDNCDRRLVAGVLSPDLLTITGPEVMTCPNSGTFRFRRQ